MAEATRPACTIAVVPGDGIGPEVVREGLKVLEVALAKSGAPRCVCESIPAGAELYRRTADAFPTESREACRTADAILLGATGLPDVRLPDGTGVSVAWELRIMLDLFAAVRPVRLFHAALSPLKRVEADQIRMTVVRENTEGIYATRRSGTLLHNQVASNTIVVTRHATERIMRVAFDLARAGTGAPKDGRRRVTCVDKSNVLTAWAFFRQIFEEVGNAYPDIERDRAYVDASTLLLVRDPMRFDVLVAENQHGDILSDLCAGLVGGLGFAPSGNIGIDHAMFEPVHGTAPDIAGKGVANPVATILSVAMMLRWLSGKHSEPRFANAADRIESAVGRMLAAGGRLTPDTGGDATTDAVGDAVADQIART
ncbi:MAG TPA: isocitrate/isopropylmalate dehydrogenase family protein [Candidatus Baltobacteraceae bacterium]|nr:isocitrate/isopropylmalate dehydrogenase family protein [Candidatus Baltobacteraceae bacterium]